MKLYTFAAAAVAALAVYPASSSLSPEYSLPKLDMDTKIRADVNRINVLGKMQSVTSHHLRKLEQDDENENGPDLPILCLLSWQSVLTPELIQLEPPGVLDEETGTFDYAADQNAFDAYDSSCNSLGGQTLSFDLDFSDECEIGLDKMLNYPFCFGSACDEDDIAEFGTFISNNADGDNPACATSFTVESDGYGEPFAPPGIPNECLEDILSIFISDEVYDEDFDEILEEGDGYTESLANF
jgi:hypothetical protein